jgi:hypothetical protein
MAQIQQISRRRKIRILNFFQNVGPNGSQIVPVRSLPLHAEPMKLYLKK